MPTRLDLIMLVVRDMDASVRFYRDILRLPVACQLLADGVCLPVTAIGLVHIARQVIDSRKILQIACLSRTIASCPATSQKLLKAVGGRE